MATLAGISPLSLRLNFLWSLLAVAVVNACQFGLIILLTRLGNPKMVGTYILAMAACAPFQVLGAQFRSILDTDVNHEFSLDNYLKLSLITGLFIILGVAVTVKVLGYDREVMIIIMIVAVAKALENISSVFHGIMQMYERMHLLAISFILKGTFTLLVFAVLFQAQRTLLLPLLALPVMGALVLFGYDIPCGLKVSRQGGMKRAGRVAMRDVAGLMQKTAPLSLTALMISLSGTVPRFFLERCSGLQALGFFGPIAYVLSLADLVAAALGRSLAPRVARYWSADRTALKLIVGKIMLLLVALSLGGILLVLAFGGRLLAFLYGNDYIPYATVFFWLTVAASLNVFAQFLAYILTAMRQLNCQAILSLATLGIIAVLCYVLIPPFGIWGTAWAICAGTLFRGAVSCALYFKSSFQTSS
jgi:O-antigen/teichoic acid export membrane protein